MANTKLNLPATFSFGFLLCSLVLTVASSDESDPTPNPVDGSELSLVLHRLAQIVEQRSREHEKVVGEMKVLKEQFKSFQSAQETCNAQVEALSEKLNDFENKISEDSGVWLLTPPLRGPPGKQGDQGPKGEQGLKGEQSLVGPAKQLSKGDQVQGISALQSTIKSCSEAMDILSSPRSKKQTIHPHGNTTSVQVLCDFETDGGGWTLIQKRSSGSKHDFDRNWNDYANGFGSLGGNFWLGLENIHALTKNGDQELRVELEDFEGNEAYAKYSSFSISDASDFYKLSISGFSGNAGDSMDYNNQMKFTTKDKDNDNHWNSDGNCAVDYSSGWWFNSCFYANLNGLIRNKEDHHTSDGKGIRWYHWKNEYYSLAKTEMKIRKRK